MQVALRHRLYPMRWSIFVRYLLVLLCLTHFGCGGRKLKPAKEEVQEKKVNIEAPSDVERKPWELWGLGRDLNGISIQNEAIRKGDALVREGNYAEALREYLAINTASLPVDEQRALIARIAGAQISVGQYSAGLDAISSYIARQGMGAESVDGYYAIILGYGYGALGDVDQSLAWFGRADSTPSNSPIFSNTAALGAKQLVQAIPQASFDIIFAKWKDDLHFSDLFQRERAIRISPEYKPQSNAFAGGAFWTQQSGATIETPLQYDSSLAHLESFTVGVMLPLSGAFAPLGQGTRNGMETAIEVEQEPRIKVVFKDDQGDVGVTQNAALELARQEKVNVLVGSLLSEPANAIRRVAVQTRIAQLSLSKANVFETGENIFRLGATSNSQMDTLLDACTEKLHMTKFALVYPENNIGLEYANAFKKYISAKGLELLYEGTYGPQDAGKKGMLAAELEKLPVEGIFVPDSIEQARELFSLFPESFRDRVRPLGPATWDDPQALSQSQAVFRGAIFVSPFFAGNSNPLVARFIEKYTQKFGKKPDFLAAQGFDAMTIIIGAARKTLASGTPFELALKDVEQYDGLTGTMRVDVSGEVQRSYAVVEARNGELRALGNEVRIGKEDKKEEADSSTQSAPVQ